MKLPQIDLVNDQLRGAADAVRNTYKQKNSVWNRVKMTGDLMKPSISFDIVFMIVCSCRGH
jgi:hypothetical protein